jgi:hypothetical protein
VSTAFELKTGDPNFSLSQEIADTSLGFCSETSVNNKNQVFVCSVEFQNNPVDSSRTSIFKLSHYPTIT